MSKCLISLRIQSAVNGGKIDSLFSVTKQLHESYISMAEALISSPTMVHKTRVPMSARMQSPTSAFFVGSNDDQLERAQARAARAAAIRHHKSLAVNFHSHRPKSIPCLNKHQILELFHNCIKLASENVIIKIVIAYYSFCCLVFLIIYWLCSEMKFILFCAENQSEKHVGVGFDRSPHRYY